MFWLVLVFLLLANPVGAAGKKDADSYYQQGRWALAAQEYERLIPLEKQPSREDMKNLAWSLFNGEQFERSYDEWKKIESLFPDDAEARINIVMLECLRDRNISRLDGMLQKEGNKNPLLVRAMAIAALWLKPPAQAIKYFTEELELDADDYMSWFWLGTVYEQQENYDEAIKAYMRAVDADPHFAQALNNLGYNCKEKGYYTFALRYYKDAIGEDPSNSGYYYNLGNVYTIKGMIPDAYDSYKKALSLDPAFAKAHYNMGMTYERMGAPKAAIEEFKLYIKYWNPSIPIEDAPPIEYVKKQISRLREDGR